MSDGDEVEGAEFDAAPRRGGERPPALRAVAADRGHRADPLRADDVDGSGSVGGAGEAVRERAEPVDADEPPRVVVEGRERARVEDADGAATPLGDEAGVEPRLRQGLESGAGRRREVLGGVVEGIRLAGGWIERVARAHAAPAGVLARVEHRREDAARGELLGEDEPGDAPAHDGDLGRVPHRVSPPRATRDAI